MSINRDYSKGDEFVPKGAFPSVTDPGQGPKNPSVTNVGPTAIPVWAGSAHGDIIRQDGGRTMDSEKPKFKGKLPARSAHLPENA